MAGGHNALVRKAVVVLAASPDLPARTGVPDNATVIAPDGGSELAIMLGLEIDLLVGDLDSVSAETLARARRVEKHPAEKDATDLELALSAALRFEPERVLVLGGAGGRLDHLLGVLLSLADERLAAVSVDAQLGDAAVHVIRGECVLNGHAGELISLFAINGRASGLYAEGLVYPLAGDTLEPGSSRGVSNLFASAQARITVGDGVLVAVRPNGNALEGRLDPRPT
jgi:thiamine pyrophosphokinase